ncbi:MAG: exopolysaccharide biosynthesis polyprenyl glycosylphosphotransferase [Bacteroidota bacterium]
MRLSNRNIVILILLLDVGLLSYSVMMVSYYHYGSIASLEKLIYLLNLVWLATYLVHLNHRFFSQQIFRVRFLQLVRRWLTFVSISAVIFLLAEPLPVKGQILLQPALMFLLLNVPVTMVVNRLINSSLQYPLNRKILIAGAGSVGKALQDYYRSHPFLGSVVGFIDNYKEPTAKNQILGTFEDFEKIVESRPIHELLITTSLHDEETIRKMINKAEHSGIRPSVVANYFTIFRRNFEMQNFGGIPVVHIREVPLDHYVPRFWKRVFDLLFSSIVLILLSPVLLAIAVAIKLESRGPVFYRPVRVGKYGSSVRIYKFRSMKHHTGPTPDRSTSKNDERITKVGKFIRKYSLDELPQFINVFQGNMSVVGPRPHRLDLELRFRQVIPTYAVRQYIKPGITGWAQVNGWRGPAETKHQYIGRTLHDLWYIEHWSFMLDVAIVFLTVFGKRTRQNAF